LKFKLALPFERIFFSRISDETGNDQGENKTYLLPVRKHPPQGIRPSVITFVCLTLCTLLASCGKIQPTLEGIDMTLWKADRNGCGNERSRSVEKLQMQKAKLLAYSELDIVGIIGKPDRNELSTRNQKIYYYFLEPSPDCQQRHDDLTPARLAIRFNAMGLAKEIRIEQEY
jgi:hypothetical protein